MDNYIKYDELRDAIKKSEHSQLSLAEAINMNQSHISLFINGKRGLSYFSFVAICNAIKRDPKDFLTETGKKVLTLELK